MRCLSDGNGHASNRFENAGSPTGAAAAGADTLAGILDALRDDSHHDHQSRPVFCAVAGPSRGSRTGHGVPLDGSAAPDKLNGSLVAGGDVRGITAAVPSFRLTPDGQQVVCSADPFFDEQLELFGVPIDGSAAW